MGDVLKQIDRKEGDNNKEIDLNEIQKALDEGFFDKKDKIGNVIKVLDENESKLIASYTESLITGVSDIFKKLGENKNDCSLLTVQEKKMLQLYDVTLLQKDETGIIDGNITDYNAIQKIEDQFIKTLTNEKKFPFFLQEASNDGKYFADKEEITYENGKLVYNKWSQKIVGSALGELSMDQDTINDFIDKSRIAAKQGAIQGYIDQLPVVVGQTFLLSKEDNTVSITVEEGSVDMSETIKIDDITDATMVSEDVFIKYIQPKIDVLEKKHHKIDEINFDTDKKTISTAEINISLNEFTPEDRKDVKASMAEEKNKDVAESLKTGLTTYYDSIMKTFAKKPDTIPSIAIPILNLYLYLIEGKDVVVNAEKGTILKNYLATKKAERVNSLSEVVADDYYINNLTKDFGLKTLKKFPTLKEAENISKDTITDYFDLSDENATDENKEMIANNLKSWAIDYLTLDPKAVIPENSTLTSLKITKKNKEAEVKTNEATKKVYDSLVANKTAFESGKFKISSSNVTNTCKALAYFISENYDDVKMKSIIANRSANDEMMKFVIKNDTLDINSTDKDNPLKTLENIFNIYSISVLANLPDSKNPDIRDERLLKMYTILKDTPSREITDAEIDLAIPSKNAADTKKATYLKAHKADVKIVLTKWKRRETYADNTELVLENRKMKFPDTMTDDTKKFWDIYNGTLNTINIEIAAHKKAIEDARTNTNKAYEELASIDTEIGRISNKMFYGTATTEESARYKKLKEKRIPYAAKERIAYDSINSTTIDYYNYMKTVTSTLDTLNDKYIDTIIKVHGYRIAEVQALGAIDSPFGSGIRLDFSNYSGIKGGTKSVIRDTFWEKVGDKRESDPEGAIIDLVAIIGAAIVAAIAVAATDGAATPFVTMLVAGGTFFAVDNIIKMVGHGVVETIKNENNPEGMNSFSYGALKGFGAIDEGTGKLKDTSDILLSKGFELVNDILLYGALGKTLAGASNIAGKIISEAGTKVAESAVGKVVTKGLALGIEGTAFNFYNSLISGPMQTGITVLVKDGDADKAWSSMKASRADAVNPVNMVYGILYNTAFIGCIKAGSGIVSPITAKMIDRVENTKIETNIKNAETYSIEIKAKFAELQKEGYKMEMKQENGLITGFEIKDATGIIVNIKEVSPGIDALNTKLTEANDAIQKGYDKIIIKSRAEMELETSKGKLLKLMTDYKLLNTFRSPEKILDEKIAKLKIKSDASSKEALVELEKIKAEYVAAKNAVDREDQVVENKIVENQGVTADKVVDNVVTKKTVSREIVKANAAITDPTERINAAKLLPGLEKITPEQEQAILAAHKVGGIKDEVYKYTRAEIREKVKILEKAGFDKDQRRALIENGICGRIEDHIMLIKENVAKVEAKLKENGIDVNTSSSEEVASGEKLNKDTVEAEMDSLDKGLQEIEKGLESTSPSSKEITKKKLDIIKVQLKKLIDYATDELKSLKSDVKTANGFFEKLDAIIVRVSKIVSILVEIIPESNHEEFIAINTIDFLLFEYMEIRMSRQIDAIKADEIKIDEISTAEIKADEIKIAGIKADEIKTNEIKADEIKIDKIEANEIKIDKTKTNEIKADEIKIDKIEANEIKIDKIIKADEVKIDKTKTNETILENIKSDKYKETQPFKDFLKEYTTLRDIEVAKGKEVDFDKRFLTTLELHDKGLEYYDKTGELVTGKSINDYLENIGVEPKSDLGKKINEYAFYQTLDNPPQYNSHGFDHSINVTSYVEMIYKQVPEFVDKVKNSYGLNEKTSQFVLKMTGVLHDFGYPETETIKAPKSLHGPLGAILFEKNIMPEFKKQIQLMDPNITEENLNQVCKDMYNAVFFHSADKVEVTYNGKMTYKNMTFLFEDALGVDGIVDALNKSGMFTDQIDKGEIIFEINSEKTDLSDKIKTKYGDKNVTTQAKEFKGRKVGNDIPGVGIEFQTSSIDSPLSSIIRIADNLDIAYSRLSPTQKDPGFRDIIHSFGPECTGGKLMELMEKYDDAIKDLEKGKVEQVDVDKALSKIQEFIKNNSKIKIFINGVETEVAISESDIIDGGKPNTDNYKDFIIKQIGVTDVTVKEVGKKQNSISVRHSGGLEPIHDLSDVKINYVEESGNYVIKVNVNKAEFDKLNATTVMEEGLDVNGNKIYIEVGIGEYHIRRLYEATRSIDLSGKKCKIQVMGDDGKLIDMGYTYQGTKAYEGKVSFDKGETYQEVKNSSNFGTSYEVKEVDNNGDSEYFLSFDQAKNTTISTLGKNIITIGDKKYFRLTKTDVQILSEASKI
ncbi:MAG: hypothetical protein NT085_03560 [candidate division SR1 bacterium]|nr:hypothetical protein [candidate division SR1 bacterium]